MARSKLTNTTNDLISDGGAVLWSLVTGEQLEFPVTLNFIKDATLKSSNNYEYEAVVIEADNVEGQTTKPSYIKPNGVQTKLVVRIPEYAGEWNSAELYMKEDLVIYDGKSYRLITNSGYSSLTPPDADPNWIETPLNRIYLQFPKELGSTWTVKATVDSPVYGFFELRVTEPVSAAFARTWKPVRGMVQLLFSPTDISPD